MWYSAVSFSTSGLFLCMCSVVKYVAVLCIYLQVGVVWCSTVSFSNLECGVVRGIKVCSSVVKCGLVMCSVVW